MSTATRLLLPPLRAAREAPERRPTPSLDRLLNEIQRAVGRLIRVAVEAATYGSDVWVIRCLGVRPRRGLILQNRTLITQLARPPLRQGGQGVMV